MDSLSPYYDVALKKARLQALEKFAAFRFIAGDLSLAETYEALPNDFTHVVHLAAQPGVRHSLKAPTDYIRDNVLASTLMLEFARTLPHLRHYLYASSSSVYGANEKQPFSESDVVRRPNSLYAATKGACELIGRSYASLYGLPQTGLRFFTVYGPWGRPDMAPWLFAAAILQGKPIRVFNHGNLKRDFTYIDDITAGIEAALNVPPQKTENDVPHRVVNLGNNQPVKLMDFIAEIERAAGKKAELVMEDMQPGDVYETYADIEVAQRLYGYSPKTPLSQGIPQFMEWFKSYNAYS